MAITGVTEKEYRDYLKNGGELTFEIDSTDIDPTGQFESSPLIAPYLSSGFEIKPSASIYQPKEAAQLYLYGDSWTKVETFTYRRGGTITYRKLLNGRYEAKVSAR